MQSRDYLVTVTHPTNYHSGTKTFRVYDSAGRAGARHVTCDGFGCSRDYYVKTDADAIRAFLPEHACTAAAIEPVGPDLFACVGHRVKVRVPKLSRKFHRGLNDKCGMVEIVKVDCIHVALDNGGTAIVDGAWLKVVA